MANDAESSRPQLTGRPAERVAAAAHCLIAQPRDLRASRLAAASSAIASGARSSSGSAASHPAGRPAMPSGALTITLSSSSRSSNGGDGATRPLCQQCSLHQHFDRSVPYCWRRRRYQYWSADESLARWRRQNQYGSSAGRLPISDVRAGCVSETDRFWGIKLARP